MRRLFLAFLLSLVAGMSGCDSLSYRQYLIRDATDIDKGKVAAVIGEAASETGLSDVTPESRAPRTIVYFLEPKEHFPAALGARSVGDSIVVDLSCFHPGPAFAAPDAYKVADALLSKELPKVFGKRLIVDPRPRISIQLEAENQPAHWREAFCPVTGRTG